MKNISILFFYITVLLYGCAEKKHSSSADQPIDSNYTISDSSSRTISYSLEDTNQYLYDFLKMVIKDQKLQYSYGLSPNVEPTLSHGDDYAYLINFIKTSSSANVKQKERIRYKDSLQKINIADSSVLIKAAAPFGFMPPSTPFSLHPACLTKSDLAYILDEKKRLKNFNWDNQRLGFNLSNEDNWYVFSLPCFSQDKKTAFISIRSLCKPFLCGSGYILLYRFENNTWTSTQVNSWVH